MLGTFMGVYSDGLLFPVRCKSEGFHPSVRCSGCEKCDAFATYFSYDHPVRSLQVSFYQVSMVVLLYLLFGWAGFHPYTWLWG